MNATIINSLYRETDDIISQLNETGEISLSSDAKRQFTKIFVLSAASYFEDRIQKMLISFAAKHSNNNKYLISFLKKKAINLQYHTYFDWGKKNDPENPGKNANAFFSLFGPEFKESISRAISKEEDIQYSIKCFIEIGHIRNILVHSNFASYNSLSKTLDEFYKLYEEAEKFVDYLEAILMEEQTLNTA